MIFEIYQVVLSLFGTTMLGLLGGYLISKHFHRKANQETPDWARPLLEELPREKPDDVAKAIADAVEHATKNMVTAGESEW